MKVLSLICIVLGAGILGAVAVALLVAGFFWLFNKILLSILGESIFRR